MRNIFLTIRFIGTNYCGYQVQKNGVTIAEKIQDSIEAVTSVRSDIKGCSRTDSGVHANQYCLNFYTHSQIPCDKLRKALNYYLPLDISVTSCSEVEKDFHARYSSKGKEYVYLIHNAPYRDPFLQNLAYEYPYNINIDKIQKAADFMTGTHDFKSFCSTKTDIENTIRTIYYFNIKQENELVKLYIAGDGFLFNMVRIMVGTLLWVNQGRISEDSIPEIISKKDRNSSGVTAPAHGLYLNKVLY